CTSATTPSSALTPPKLMSGCCWKPLPAMRRCSSGVTKWKPPGASLIRCAKRGRDGRSAQRSFIPREPGGLWRPMNCWPSAATPGAIRSRLPKPSVAGPPSILSFSNSMSNYELFSFATDDALAEAVASRWLDELAAQADDPAPYCLALSGGRIAKKLFAAVAERAPARSVSLGHVHFFWADERCVSPSDGESKFGLAQAHLLGPLAISPDKIHRVRGEISPKWAAAE